MAESEEKKKKPRSQEVLLSPRLARSEIDVGSRSIISRHARTVPQSSLVNIITNRIKKNELYTSKK